MPGGAHRRVLVRRCRAACFGGPRCVLGRRALDDAAVDERSVAPWAGAEPVATIEGDALVERAGRRQVGTGRPVGHSVRTRGGREAPRERAYVHTRESEAVRVGFVEREWLGGPATHRGLHHGAKERARAGDAADALHGRAVEVADPHADRDLPREADGPVVPESPSRCLSWPPRGTAARAPTARPKEPTRARPSCKMSASTRATGSGMTRRACSAPDRASGTEDPPANVALFTARTGNHSPPRASMAYAFVSSSSVTSPSPSASPGP